MSASKCDNLVPCFYLYINGNKSKFWFDIKTSDLAIFMFQIMKDDT